MEKTLTDFSSGGILWQITQVVVLAVAVYLLFKVYNHFKKKNS